MKRLTCSPFGFTKLPESFAIFTRFTRGWQPMCANRLSIEEETSCTPFDGR